MANIVNITVKGDNKFSATAQQVAKDVAAITAPVKQAEKAVSDLTDELGHVNDHDAALREVAARADNAGEQLRGAAEDAALLAHELDKTSHSAVEAAVALKLPGGGSAGGSGGGAFRAGQQAGQSLFKGMQQDFEKLGGLRQIITNPYVIAALAPAAIEVGVAAGGALLAGIGLAGVGAGIAGQIKSPEVTAAVASLQSEVSSGFKDATASFEQPLVHAIGVARAEWASLAPGLTSTFEKLSPLVGDLTEGMAGFADKVVPAIERAAVTSAPLVKNLAQELPSIGNQLGLLFDTLARNADTLNGGLELALGTLKLLIGAADWTVQVFSTLFKLGEYTTGTIDAIKELGTSSGETTTHMIKMSDTADTLATKQGALKTAVDAATQAFEKQLSDMLGSDSAAINYEQAVDDLTASVRENGRTLDIHTEKGRNNRRALDAVVAGLEATYRANIAAGMGADKAGNAFAQQVDALRAQMTALHFSKADIDAYIDALNRMRYAAIAANNAIHDTGTGHTHHDSFATGGITAAATGRNTGSGMTWVGEQGPELVRLPVGAHVFSNPDTRRMASGMVLPGGGRGSGAVAAAAPAQSGGSAEVRTTVDFSGDVDSAVATMFQRLIRERKITILSSAVVTGS